MVDPKAANMICRLLLVLLIVGCGCASQPGPPPLPFERLAGGMLWVPVVRNVTDADLRLPAANPVRALAEIAGKASADERPTVMELIRTAIKRELETRKVRGRFPEEHDRRLAVLPLSAEAAARVARSGALEGSLLLTEIRRWEIDPPDLTRLWVAFKLVRIADGATLWERTVQKVVPATRPGSAEMYHDAISAVVRDLF